MEQERTTLPLGLHPLDWIAIALLVAGGGCTVSGLLPAADAIATMQRILPLLIFLAAVIVLAELTAEAGVFDVIATRMAILAGGNYLALFLLCVAFASVTTASLNLDTTAVLLTPVMLATARRANISALPLAMTTVWLANTASLLLPVSNLTNLLASNRVALTPSSFAHRMLVPEVVSISATMCCLWVFYWRRGRRGSERYLPPAPHRPKDRVLFVLAALACTLFVASIVIGLPLGVAAAVCAGAVAAAYAVRARGTLRPRLIPWRLLVFVTGLFLVVQTVSLHGLDRLVRLAVGVDGGAAGVFRAAAAGAALSNLVNNLPSYVAGESVLPVANHQQLLGLLVGTNVGPIVTPWASLATILWYERCHGDGLEISWLRFLLTGAVTASCALMAAVFGLVATG